MPGCLLVALEIAAFRTWAKVGLIPQARQGGNGVCSLAVVGSKLDGTGLEKLQIVQTHVAVLTGAGSTGEFRRAPSDRCAGEGLLLREGPVTRAGDRGCTDARFVGLGIRVIFADDLRKPACSKISQHSSLDLKISPTYIKLVPLHILEI